MRAAPGLQKTLTFFEERQHCLPFAGLLQLAGEQHVGAEGAFDRRAGCPGGRGKFLLRAGYVAFAQKNPPQYFGEQW